MPLQNFDLSLPRFPGTSSFPVALIKVAGVQLVYVLTREVSVFFVMWSYSGNGVVNHVFIV